ncbi:SDR family NAD(P)-dependent oxidoreductase [Methylophaga sp.]|uniref:SDR family NAD(P)-dependent oxidoreductase n=1 Tax=Methylophaga sp. TaxID=2024840 RepID=UPI0013FEDB33|nr:SDR family NAD(P)-dependent oxidoreductase [Methylophaga sp.]MTI63601.1 SDR family NAD(P)-dependent oxidoreductase [Methylophaga sp.]
MSDYAEADKLRDRVILITGAARGIGASVAQACAAKGATVVLLDKHIPGLESVYDDIIASGAPTPAIYPLDLKGASVPDYQQLANTLESQFGRLDGLVHCAATLGQLAPVEHQDSKTWLETLHINLTGAYLLTRACLTMLKKQAGSCLIFSTDAHKHKAYWGAYGISKAAIEALAAQLAEESEAQGNLKVHCIEPGSVQTELFARAFPATDPGALPKPEQVAPRYIDLICEADHRQAT